MTDKSDNVLTQPSLPTLADSLAALTDADIVTRCFGPERQSLPDADHQDASHIAVITEVTVSKFEYDGDIDGAYPIEAFALEILAQHTTIPVPRVHRIVQQERGHIIVMDHIPGKQLSKLWPAMSIEEKDRIAETLAGYRKWLGVGDPSIPPMDDSYPLVLTHHDIHPHNLILDDAGTLWMVDWVGAGVYPEWWEALAMELRAIRTGQDESWAAIVPRVCGEYPERQRAWMKGIRRSFP
ncbi:kinase-like domain-containing protein [Roridomyces roridus]|uniref:Kinase-like domain-containing protein n=1 Tax=Roridomyces roridus TaxID=1738132 RepID=A0AAD7FS72_9AGAR|nr:kinase-like domain-containing protein [Roridomyces roridus]